MTRGCQCVPLLCTLPLFSNCSNIDLTLLSLGHHGTRLADDGCIDHLALKGPRTLALSQGILLGDEQPHGPLDLLLARGKESLDRADLGRVDALLPVEAHGPAAATLVLENGEAALALVLRADEVDGAGQAGGPGGGDDGGAGVQELVQAGRAGDGQVQGKVLGGEDEAVEERRGAADGGQVHDGAGRLDEGEELDGRAGGRGRAEVREDRGHKGQGGGRVDLGDDDGGEAREGREERQVGEGEGRGGRVDAHRDFAG